VNKNSRRQSHLSINMLDRSLHHVMFFLSWYPIIKGIIRKFS